MPGERFVRGAAFALSWLAGILLFAQQPSPEFTLDEAARYFEQGKTAEAEQKLRLVLEKQPSNLLAVLLEGAVLDSEQRYDEADAYYQRALKIAPGSAQVLNNTANHYLASGKHGQARDFYRKAVAIDPQHANANLQLARLSVEDKLGRQALTYLNRVGHAESSDPVILELRARALSLIGECSQASETASRLESQPAGDWRVHFSAAAVYAECKLYDRAEASFSRALDANPQNFDILYNLGMAAMHAGHIARAASVFEIALHERPEDTDCLYALAQAHLQGHRTIDAAALLTKAARIAPERADILLLLARVSAQLEFYQDSAATFDRYLKLKPGDEVAHRERAFALASAGQFKSALPDLERYVRMHPRDATGLYELAMAQAFEDPGKALQLLDRALALDTGMTQALYTRAGLNLEEGNPAKSIADMRLVLEREPGNYHALVRLGQAYLALDRAGDAEQVLKRALDLAPDSSSALTVYARALKKLGRDQEASATLARVKQSAEAVEASKQARAGLIDYLGLPPAEQRARYLANLRKNIATDPGDARWRIRLGTELFSDGQNAEALEIFRELRTSITDPEALGRCGTILLQFEQHELARQFLESAISAAPSLSAVRLDLATALFHLAGADVALRELEKTPESNRKGDYYLLRAQFLDSAGKIPEAVDALNRGMQAAPTKASLYFQAASFLLKHLQNREALALLEQANSIVPDVRELLLAQWVTLILLQHDIDAKKLLARIQARWPEWHHPYLLNGIFLEMMLHSSEARQALETAIALGANTPEAYYYQALAITHSAPEDVEAAENAIARALALASKDPWAYLLAGKISLVRKDYSTAIRRLLEATHLEPAMIPAHYALRTAYTALGDQEKSAAELNEIKRIGQENAVSDKKPLADFLFTVRPPS